MKTANKMRRMKYVQEREIFYSVYNKRRYMKCIFFNNQFISFNSPDIFFRHTVDT